MSRTLRARLIPLVLWIAAAIGMAWPLAGAQAARASASQSIARNAAIARECAGRAAVCRPSAPDSTGADAATTALLPPSPAATPTLSIDDVTHDEGDGGTTNFVFTVTLSSSSFVTATVNYDTASGTANPGSDYSSKSGFLVLSSFQPQATITVTVFGDTTPESDEVFAVNLYNPVGANLIDSQGVGTILNDDSLPVIVLGPDFVTEGSAGTINLTLPISLTVASASTVTVDYQTADGTATAATDYLARQGTVSFSPGVKRTSITIPIVGDTIDENDENFYIYLSNPHNATIFDSQDTVTIYDDDAPPSLSIDNISVQESASGTTPANFAVKLSAPSAKNVSVNYQTVDSTATAPADYAARQGTLVFPPGTTQQTIAVPVNADAISEPNETFLVQLSGVVNATIADSQGVGTIINRATQTQHRSYIPMLLRPIPILACNDVEPNGVPKTASPLTSINQYCVGSLEGEEAAPNADDIYTLSLNAGQQLAVDVLDVPTGANYRLTVWYNVTSTQPIVVGESNQPGSSSEHIAAQISVTSKYYIRIRRMAAGPSADTYLLHVTVR